MDTRFLAPLLAAAFGLLAAGSTAAQVVFKWVDDKGVTHYTEKSPEGRPSKQVDITPSGSTLEPGVARECHTIQCQYDRLRDQRQKYEEQQRADERAEARESSARPAFRGMSFDTFRRLSTGMSEGEVLLRAGPPDYQSNQFFSGYIGKTWYYYPTNSDPFTTVIQISGGQVFSLSRIRQF